ncbi:MAG: EAL domain-containing protein, partial [Clostridia bacterium]|nr:EAL domain-containing protein [Clostridia bacterium]
IRTSAAEDVILLAGHALPLRSLTGAFSSMSNLCLILVVVFYKKPGFYITLAILFMQFLTLGFQIAVQRNLSVISGFCLNILTFMATILIYATNSQNEKIQTRLRNQAVTDRLTGLPNRFACSELMDVLIEQKEKFVVAVINLNNFKMINNTMGQGAGNRALQEIASRWRKAADQNLSGTHDFITCQGGDEFCLIIRDYQSDADILRTLDYYQALLEDKITFDNCDYFLTARIGYAEYPNDAKNSDELMARALKALYQTKLNNSSNPVCRFAPEMISDEHDMETEQVIRAALKDGTIFFCLQPQYDISHKLRGFEVLARMKDKNGCMVSPAEFIPVAEKVGLIDKVDRTVFRESAKFFGALIRQTQMDHLTLSVNVSVRHLMRNDFVDEVRNILELSGLPANQLEIEITESILIDSFEKALQCLNDIKNMGIKVAIDDFGTGYSSLSYLNTFPADLLKVDKSFIDKMNTSDSSKQYVAAIISIGHVMNFDVIAEGVEKTEQLDTLRDIGCDYVQGFLWGRPLLPEAAEALVIDSSKQVIEKNSI